MAETHEQAVKRGKRSRAEGKTFEKRVREDLLQKGYVVTRFDNDVKEDKLVQAKTSWRRTPHGMFPMNITPGFPDFLIFKPIEVSPIIGVESKITGTLDKPEKEKCRYYLDNGIFDKIWIAEKTKVKNRVVIVYHDFEEKYGKKG